MTNIEKLAIEHGITITHNGYAGETDLLNIETAEAFAKALQSSEPVAEVGTYIGDADDAHGIFSYQVFNGSPLISGESKLFTNPPASVPLEKYNKLVERLHISNRHIKDWWNNFGEGGSSLPPAHSARLVDENEQAIAEAELSEGKEG